MNDKYDFVVKLFRPETKTTIRWIEQFDIVNSTTGRFYTQQEFGLYLLPYVNGIQKEYPHFEVFISLATNEEIEELSERTKA